MACDYCTIRSGVKDLDLHGNAVPIDLVLIGADAFPLAMNPRGQVLIAASRYGQGCMVVLRHEGYLSRFPSLIENALMWLMPCTSDASIVGIQRKLGSVADNLRNSSISTKLGEFCEGLAVYITDAYSVDACAKNLIAFVKAGGGLIIAGQAWSWAKAHPQENVFLNFPGNKVCSVAGIYFTEHPGERGVFPVSSNIPSSWLADFKNDLEILLKGVPQFDIQGSLASELMVHGPFAFPIAVTPAGQTFIAGAYYGQGRVIVVTHEGYLGRESLSTFLINAINWLDEGRKGVIGIIPSLTGAQKILSKSGLNCQLTNFREDLSVHVCTSYSDAECEKIQICCSCIYVIQCFMHAGYPIMMHSTSAPELMKPKKANKSDLWGFIHELGHNQQRGVWEFPPHTTECTCNLWSVYVHEKVLGIDRATAHEAMTLKKRQDRARDYAKGGRDLEKWTMWTALETYMQLQDKFGWDVHSVTDAFKKVFAAYHDMTGVPNNNPGKMNLYAETFSKVVKMNLSSFFKAWGWPIEPSTEQKISHLPEWSDHPMKQYE
ncbi:TRPM8 channel-associated factor homolog [Misgurnus anguillicaudatus]|uniref:TRPM8 channel-associated factor homolog n=1 Tax=Misgurnus anguillicaudatus TaxID=75329 RepID=UPI003CCFAF15